MKKIIFQNSDIELIVVSYLTGSISEVDLEKLNEWINDSNENRSHFNSLKDTWILSGTNNISSLTNTEESWNGFRKNLSHKWLRVGVKSREKVRMNKYFKLAASWLLFFGIGSVVTLLLTENPAEPIAVTENRITEISTPLGARSKISMPDNTQVWLNAGTTVSYTQDYGQHTRTINLKGEAFFDVAKDSQHPFIVNTEGVVVYALGTRFNVKAYPEEKTISATLETGKIDIKTSSMSDKKERILLKPKDKLIYHKETRETEKYTESPEEKVKPAKSSQAKFKDISVLSNVRTELSTSWKDPRWIIDREPLSSLAPMLERRFNLKIIFGDDLIRKYKFTGTIENETINQLMNALKLTAPLDFQISKDTLRLTLDNNETEKFKKIMTEKN